VLTLAGNAGAIVDGVVFFSGLGYAWEHRGPPVWNAC
jgi:hypothetical protein